MSSLSFLFLPFFSFLLLLLLSVTDGQRVEPLPYNMWSSKRVMFISAHPDDIEACAGGTISLLTQQGTEIFYVIVTNGDKGCGNARVCGNVTNEQLASIRHKEALRGAKVLGIPSSHVLLLDYEDAMVTSYPEIQLKTDLISAIRTYQPHIVMSWFPYPRFDLVPSEGWDDMGFHPDHQAVGRLVLEAQYESGLNRLLPLITPAWRVQEFYMWEFTQPTRYVDITETLQNKIDSLLKHESQYSNASQVIEWTTELAAWVATAAGLGNLSKAAEGFIAYF